MTIKNLNLEFFKASIFSAISSVIKILTSLILGKVIATKLGAEGLALFGQLLSFVTIIMVFGGGAINQGVVKYVAEFESTSASSLKKLISTSIRFILLSCVTVGILMIVISSYLSDKILKTSEYNTIFIIFGFSLIFYGLNNLLISIINGLKKYKTTNLINIYSSITGLVLTLVLIYFYNIYGALVSVVINQFFYFIITLYILRKEVWIKRYLVIPKIHKKTLKLLMGFGLLTIVSTATTPMVALFIRNLLIEDVSLASAGLYEFVTRISGASIMFFSLTISTYFLPKISELKLKKDIVKEAKSVYKIIIPITILLLISIFLLRFFIIKIFASDDFLLSADLFKYQLIGDFFKIISIVIGFQFVAKAYIKISLFTELLYNSILLVLSYSFINSFGLKGASVAYMCAYITYFVYLSIFYYFTFIKIKK